MLEILGEDRERIEELHREIKKEQERICTDPKKLDK